MYVSFLPVIRVGPVLAEVVLVLHLLRRFLYVRVQHFRAGGHLCHFLYDHGIVDGFVSTASPRASTAAIACITSRNP